MKKNVWIMNHYATNMYFDQAGRHYWFAEGLLKKGYNPTIFCASTNHFSDKDIDTESNSFIEKNLNKIPFIFVNTPEYKGNKVKRIFNMISFFCGLFKVTKDIAKKNGRPDVILASSVHPLTLVAGILIAKKFNIPCICEVRDLWPESIVAYGSLKRESIVAKILYQGEKWIYKRADSIIMTWEGGSQYILDQGWGKTINLEKIYHISNGIIIKSFDKNSQEYKIYDQDLENKDYKNLVYTGSIRKVNNLESLIEAAKLIQDRDKTIRFLVYGTGDEKDKLEKKCIEENINNVIFKGRVEKKFIPSIIKESYANILHNQSTVLNKYGQSQNKLFEYLAAGKCIIQTYSTGYSILEKYNCGVSVSNQTPDGIAEIILDICKDKKKSKEYGVNARKAALIYDFKKLTNELVNIIENG